MTAPRLEAGIVSNDGAALAGFYCSAFGFEVVKVLEFPEGTVHRLARGSTGLKIFQPADEPLPAEDTITWSGRVGFAYAAIHVDDAPAAVDAAVAQGARVTADVTSHRRGARMALITDPDGNMLEILQED